MDTTKPIRPSEPLTQKSLALIKITAGQSGRVDALLLLKKEFVSMDKVVDRLYISGFYGLTKDNLKKHKITHAIRCDSKCPNMNKVDCIMIEVSNTLFSIMFSLIIVIVNFWK